MLLDAVEVTCGDLWRVGVVGWATRGVGVVYGYGLIPRWRHLT